MSKFYINNKPVTPEEFSNAVGMDVEFHFDSEGDETGIYEILSEPLAVDNTMLTVDEFCIKAKTYIDKKQDHLIDDLRDYPFKRA